MRDALSLLDRVLSLGEKHVTLEMIEQLLGLPKAQLMFDLAEAIGQADVKSTLQQTQAILMGGLSVDAMLASLVDHLRNLLILRTCGEDDELVAVPGLPTKDLAAQAQRFEVMNLSQDIAILEELRRQVRQGHGGRALVDATMVRLAMADQFAAVVDLLEQMDSGRAPEQKKNGEYRPIESPVARPITAAVAVAEQEDDALPAVGKVWDEGPKRSLATIMAQTNVPPPAVSVEPVDANDTAAVWRAMLAVLGQKGQAITGLVCQGEFAGFDEDGCAILKYKSGQSGLVRMLERKDKRDSLTEAFSRVLGKPVGVRFEISGESEESADKISKAAARSAADPSAERLTAERRAEVEADPLVKAILESFGGVVLDRSGSI
jgi:DNA polymerase-3 subunit gamma/tau